MKINWKNIGISIGIILAVLFLLLVGFSWILCVEPVITPIEGEEYDNQCSIPAEYGYLVTFVIFLISTLGSYLLLDYLLNVNL